jgi:hypothetical protein
MQVLEADKDLGKLLDKLGLYKTKLTLEFDGNSYTLGDFCVKVKRRTVASSVLWKSLRRRGRRLANSECGISVNLIEPVCQRFTRIPSLFLVCSSAGRTRKGKSLRG